MREIPLTRGYVAHVDDCDYDRVSAYKWRADVRKRAVYALTNIEGKSVRMHRFILQAPTGMEVDHRDHNGLNNVRSNLRLATHAQNTCNVRRGTKNTSGVKGVSWCSTTQRWRARVVLNGKHYHVGVFTTVDAASAAVRAKQRELQGTFMCDK